MRPLRGLVKDIEGVKDLVQDTLESMIAHGDFLEHRDVEEDATHGTRALLYAASASFVARASGTVILLGISSNQFAVLPHELAERIEYVNHLRRLTPLPDEDLRDVLVQLGLINISYDRWLRAPADETPTQHLSRLDGLLDAAQPSRDVPGLSILGPGPSGQLLPRAMDGSALPVRTVRGASQSSLWRQFMVLYSAA